MPRVFRRKGSRCWYAWVPKPGGGVRPLTTHCTDKKAAEARATELERLAVDPTYAASTATSVGRICGDYLADLRRQKRAADTLSFNERKLGHFVRVFTIDGIGPEGKKRTFELANRIEHADLQAYVDVRQGEGVMNTTILKELRALGAAWTLARKNNLLTKSWGDIKPKLDDDHKDRTRWLTPLELVGLAMVLPERRMAAAAFVAVTGCDDSALARVRLGDVAGDRSSVHIRGTKREKRNRIVPIPLPEQRFLLDWALRHADGGIGDRIFSTWENRRNDLADACFTLGIPRVSPNDLRRTYSKWCRLAGLEPALIGPAMGHKDGRMVERIYGAMTPDELAMAMALRLGSGMARLGERLMSEKAAKGSESGSIPATDENDESSQKEGDSAENAVRGDGIEPPTRGFSIPDGALGTPAEGAYSADGCATNESAPDEGAEPSPRLRESAGIRRPAFPLHEAVSNLACLLAGVSL